MEAMLEAARNKARIQKKRRQVSRTSRAVKDERLTYLSWDKLRSLESALKAVERDGVPGRTVEAGVALGGSAVVIATLLPDRTFHGYDVFGMIPAPTEKDPPEVHERYATIASGASQGIDGDEYYGYRQDLFEHVERTLRRHGAENFELHKGLFDETLHIDEPVSFAHVDCDWYDPVKLCLERLWPNLSPGGFVIMDDYHDYESCRRATDEFLAEHRDEVEVSGGPHLVVRRTR